MVVCMVHTIPMLLLYVSTITYCIVSYLLKMSLVSVVWSILQILFAITMVM